MSPAERAILGYIEKQARTLSQAYTWKLPHPCVVSFTTTGVPFHDNIQLRNALNRTWRTAPAERVRIAAWYVKQWGGVKRTSELMIAQYVATLERGILPGTYSGIASWSKIASIAAPERYAIYDARVALALNAVQLKSLSKIPIKFPILPNKNRLIVWANAHLKKLSPSIYSGSTDGSYEQYVEILTRSSIGIQAAEMALFATAPVLAGSLLQ